MVACFYLCNTGSQQTQKPRWDKTYYHILCAGYSRCSCYTASRKPDLEV